MKSTLAIRALPSQSNRDHQVVTLFFKIVLVICINKNLPNGLQNLPMYAQNFAQHKINSQKNLKTL